MITFEYLIVTGFIIEISVITNIYQRQGLFEVFIVFVLSAIYTRIDYQIYLTTVGLVAIMKPWANQDSGGMQHAMGLFLCIAV